MVLALGLVLVKRHSPLCCGITPLQFLGYLAFMLSMTGTCFDLSWALLMELTTSINGTMMAAIEKVYFLLNLMIVHHLNVFIFLNPCCNHYNILI